MDYVGKSHIYCMIKIFKCRESAIVYSIFLHKYLSWNIYHKAYVKTNLVAGVSGYRSCTCLNLISQV